MRIDKVNIKSGFKNLDGFEIDIDELAMETVLLGLNASGKSNFIEALVLIFRDLDLEQNCSFDYYIKYECHEHSIEVDFSKKNGYKFIVDGSPLTSKSSFFSNKVDYLPKHVFVYYSGVNNRIQELFIPHLKKYYDELIKKGAKYGNFNELPKVFLVENVHGSFALISLYLFNNRKEEILKFLKEELSITGFNSALFILKQPSWSKIRQNSDLFWGAQGLVRRFLENLWQFSLAPISNKENILLSYKKQESQDRQYLFVKDFETLNDLVKSGSYESEIAFFNALNSLEISDLLDSIKVNVFKENTSSEIELGLREMSEGEKQLLTVLGMLKFTREEESLILLDEPDTHLNPVWKWKYLDYLDRVVKRPEKTQIIICTHDPLVIGNLKKNQVQIIKKDSEGKTKAFNPSVSPREMSVSKILTSELFNIPSVMSKKLEDLLNQKRHLQAKLVHQKLSEEERRNFEHLKKYFDANGFNDDTIDSRYNKYLQLTSENEAFSNRKYTKEEEVELDRIAKEVLEEILKEEKK